MIVVADTSVLLNLCWLQQEKLLGELFETVLAPSVVYNEFERLAQVDARFLDIQFPPQVTVASATPIPRELSDNKALDAGELAAIALAMERGIRNILIDETAARRAAILCGLTPSGLLGILLQAKKKSLVPAVVPLIDALIDGARFYVTRDLRQRVASLAGEHING